MLAFSNTVIRDIKVGRNGGLLSTPSVTKIADGMGMKYSMTMATFNITYNAIGCGFGMELIQSHQNNTGEIEISQVSGKKSLYAKHP